MKKLISIVLTAFVGIPVFSQKAIKIGHINSTELLSAMPERPKIQKELEDYAKQLQQQLEAMQIEWQTKMQDFKAKEAEMTELVKNTKIKEITDLENRIQEFQQTAEEDLRKKEMQLMQPLIDKAKKAIEEVAKENGFTYVIDEATGVLLFSGGEDILPLVKKKLGLP